MRFKWKLGIVAGLFLALFSLYPQFKLIYNRDRGSDWNGHYAYNDIDEVAYAAYLKALIDGRPRKNDPYTGRDDSVETPQPESLFSIQFAGPYTIAIPARIVGIGAPWAMTISGALAAALTALVIFWLLGMLTKDPLFAMAGSIFVLAGGALFAGEGAIGEILGTSYSYPYFPGFRRYVPAMAFPAFFVLVGLVWKMIVSPSEDHTESVFRSRPGEAILLITLSVLAFGYTVYSYFYVWTTALAWLGCVGIVWLAARPERFGRDLKRLAILAAGCAAVLLPYAYLLSKRSHTMDDVQMLVKTRMPDLTRTPELISFVVIVVILAGALLGMFKLRDRAVLFAVSLALTPIVIFNQQILTGQSLQPIHYQVFIGNYVAGLAVAVTLGVIWRTLETDRSIAARIVLTSFAAISVVWGFVECHYTVKVLDDVNVTRDEAFPVGKRLTELARSDNDPHRSVVLNLAIAEADDMPTIAPQAVLWARHQHVFAGVTWQENKERYYQQLMYQGVGEKQLADGIKRGEDFVSMIALFGWGRHTDRLNSEYKPLTFGEIDAEAKTYGEFVKNFDPVKNGIPRLEYLVAPTDFEPYFSNVDRWYERLEREQFGKYVLYRLKLKPVE